MATRCDRYYVHVRPSKEISDAILSYRKRFEPTSSRSVPHMTILAPCCLRTGMREEDLVREISVECGRFFSFPLVIEGVGYFDGKNIVHYRVKSAESPALKAFQLSSDDLREFILILRDGALKVAAFDPIDYPYSMIPNPHVTIARFSDPERGRLVFSRASAEFKPAEFRFREAFLMRMREGEGAWSELASFNMREKP